MLIFLKYSISFIKLKFSLADTSCFKFTTFRMIGRSYILLFKKRLLCSMVLLFIDYLHITPLIGLPLSIIFLNLTIRLLVSGRRSLEYLEAMSSGWKSLSEDLTTRFFKRHSEVLRDRNIKCRRTTIEAVRVEGSAIVLEI